MKLRRRRSANVEDRRGQSPDGRRRPELPRARRRVGGGGLGGGGLPIGKGGGIGLVIVVIVLAVCVGPQLGGDGGGDLGDILGGDPFSGFGQAQPGDTTTPLDPDDKLFGFVNAVVDDVNLTWTDIFAESGTALRGGDARRVRGSDPDRLRQGLGGHRPLLLPGRQPDLPGPRVLPGAARPLRRSRRLRAGVRDRARVRPSRAEPARHQRARCSGISQQDPGRANDMSVRLELQADCLAGVWGHTALQQGELSEGDLDEALAAAESIGDDRIQETTTGRIDPESWTHGSSDQRAKWFRHRVRLGRPCELRHVPGRSAVAPGHAMNSSRSRCASIAATVAGSSVWSRSGSSTSSRSP